MTVKNMLMASTTGSAALYPEDVFSAYTYTGNASTQTITNGIDLSTNGGLVWCKNRSVTGDNILVDTTRGATNVLYSNTTGSQATVANSVTGFTTSGFSVGALAALNGSTNGISSWTFRKSAKFFDIVTWTGNGAVRTLNHNLQQVPGMIIVRGTSAGTTLSNWRVWHRSMISSAYSMILNITGGQGNTPTVWNSTAPTSSVFTLGADSSVNSAGETYVAYLFSHDATTDGIVQCGSATTDGFGDATVNLGWEPQFVISTASGEHWSIYDSSRDFALDVNATSRTKVLYANLTTADGNEIRDYPSSTGFNFSAKTASTNYLYLAIRRPNKPATVGTQIYKPIIRTGNGATTLITGVGFAPDMLLHQSRNTTGISRLHTKIASPLNYLVTDTTAGDATTTQVVEFTMDGAKITAGGSAYDVNTNTYVEHFFKRSIGVFDTVCYKGTASNNTVIHKLAVVPELIIVKQRESFNLKGWAVLATTLGATNQLMLNQNAASVADATFWNSTAPTNTVFSLGTSSTTNTGSFNYIAYLFATKAGISKVGNYTGNGGTQTINAGFTTGARFVMIKRTDSTGDWYVWDSARGIVDASEPHLSLNSSATAEATDDSIDPNTSGFIVNQIAGTNINITSASYIYLAFA